jgi:translation initiation factor eIF-2B subunit delta
LSRDLLSKLNRCIRFLIDCRPLSISMGNAFRWLKMRVSKIPVHLDEAEAKEELCTQIRTFIHERIALAATLIAERGAQKINDGDCIMTFACSSVVEGVFKEAAKTKKFRVICVDARPKLEGREMVRRLTAAGIKCSYLLITAVSYVMKDVSKVFIGAASCLTNGAVISRCGSAVLAMMAHTYKKPFLVCAETYKFNDRAQVDSICSNELGDPDDLIRIGREDGENVLADWRDVPRLKLLDLLYDLTPVEFVTMVVSEVGLIPPTSVPVILREYSSHGADD